MARKLDIEPKQESRDIQQSLYERLGDRDWNCYRLSEYDKLKQIIELAIFGVGNSIEEDSKKKIKRQEYIDKFMKKLIENVFCEGGIAIFLNVIFVVCEYENESDKKKSDENKSDENKSNENKSNEVISDENKSDEKKFDEKKYNEKKYYPVFRIRKCAASENNSLSYVNNFVNYTENLSLHEMKQIRSKLLGSDYEELLNEKSVCNTTLNNPEYCCVYMDENMRTYQSWEDYLNNNTLPKCTMVVPQNGKYSGRIVNLDEQSTEVILDVYKSPACALKKTIGKVVDVASIVTGIGSLGATGIFSISAVAAAVPFTPFILTGALVAGGVTAAVNVVQSSIKIHDRKEHKEPMSVSNAEARNLYLSIAGSVVGVMASASTKILSTVVQNGAVVGKVGRSTVNAFTAANLIINGCGVASSSYTIFEKIKNKEDVTTLDALQLSANLLFFGNAVICVRTANTIIKETQNSVLLEVELNLTSNRKRRIFQKALEESKRIKGEHIGKADIIKGLQKINNPNEFFESSCTNKLLTTSSSGLTAGQTGGLEISDFIVDDFKSPLYNSSQAPPEYNTVIQNKSSDITKIQSIVAEIVKDFVISPNVKEIIFKLLDNFTDYFKEIILEIFKAFLRETVEYTDIIAKQFPQTHPIVTFLKFIIDVIQMNAGEIAKTISPDSLKDNAEFQNCLKLVLDRFKVPATGTICMRMISKLVKYLKNILIEKCNKLIELTENKLSKSTVNNTKQVNCKTCNGYYFSSV